MMNDIHGGDWAGFQSEYGTEPLDFSMNISPLGIPIKAVEAAAKALEETAKYPDPFSRRLKSELAQFHQVSPEKIVFGSGAADIIWRLVQAARPKRALLPVPTFTEYARALISGGCEVVCERMPALEFSLTEKILDRITPDTDMLFLCEPNNPTGKLTDAELLRKILERCERTGCLLVVDECFMEFTEDPDAHSCISFLRESGRFGCLIVLRAFTKTFAMAGLRLGYAICGSQELAEQIRVSGQPWPVSVAAEAAGLAALKEKGYLETLRKQTKENRTMLEAALQDCGLTVVSGEANYILFYSDAFDLQERMKKRGILIRDCSRIEGLGQGWFRVAVRKQEENAELIRQLRQAVCRNI